jgi:SAM-dependent methyltransferase
LTIHESSPGSPGSDKLRRECLRYTPSHWFPDITPGLSKGGFRCENLEKQTFADESFDVVITQDVFEHVLDPAAGFREVARTLKPGGAHVFTVPWYYWKNTLVRAVPEPGGSVRYLVEPDYHGNPIDPHGSLVVTEWGSDLCDFIYQHSGLTTTVVRLIDRRRGIEAEFIEVFISRKRRDRKPDS